MRTGMLLFVVAMTANIVTASADTPPDPVAMFLKLFERLDRDHDGIVPLVDIFDALDLRQAEARQIKRIRALDRDGDGRVLRDEVITGVKAEIEYQTQRRLNTDADGDGELTPDEYALAIPDPDGKAETGLTPLQRNAFKADDLDGNGKVTRDEIENGLARAYASNYWALTMAVRARRADANRDGLIDEREFALLEGQPAGEPLSANLRKRFLTAEAKDGKLNHRLPSRWTLTVTASLLCLAMLSGAGLAQRGQGEAADSTRQSPAKPEDAVAAFAQFFAVIDRDRDDKVTLGDLLDAHNADADAKTLARFKGWDLNRDGFISLPEGEAGVKAYVLDQAEQQFKADGNGDGRLSLQEFALAVPDTNGEKLDGGEITRRQETMFRSADADRNGQYDRAEAIASLSRRSQSGYLGRRVAYRARVFDLNRDRKYDLDEFALIYGATSGQPVPQEILDRHRSPSFGAGNHTYYNVMMRLIHTPRAELTAIDERITAYERGRIAAASGGRTQ